MTAETVSASAWSSLREEHKAGFVFQRQITKCILHSTFTSVTTWCRLQNSRKAAQNLCTVILLSCIYCRPVYIPCSITNTHALIWKKRSMWSSGKGRKRHANICYRTRVLWRRILSLENVWSVLCHNFLFSSEGSEWLWLIRRPRVCVENLDIVPTLA